MERRLHLVVAELLGVDGLQPLAQPLRLVGVALGLPFVTALYNFISERCAGLGGVAEGK